MSRMWKAENVPLASFSMHYKEGEGLYGGGFDLLDKILRRCICCFCRLHLLRHSADHKSFIYPWLHFALRLPSWCGRYLQKLCSTACFFTAAEAPV